MSVANDQLREPILVESDLVSLSPDFLLADLHMIDKVLDAHHQISELALHSIDLLKTPITLGQWRAESTLTRSQQSELLAFLNHIGAINVKRSLPGYGQWLLQIGLSLMNGYFASPLTYRKNASIKGISLGLLRCGTWLLLVWIASLIAIYGSNIISMEDFIVSSLTTLAIMLITCLIHELAHTHIIMRSGKIPVVLQGGLRVGLVHAKLSPDQEVISAIYGPTVGSIAAIALGYIATSALQMSELVFCGYLIAAFHLVSLLPWYGDGASIIQSTKQWIRI